MKRRRRQRVWSAREAVVQGRYAEVAHTHDGERQEAVEKKKLWRSKKRGESFPGFRDR
jgi:hypothetical protein